MASTQFATTTHYVLPTRNDVAPTGYEGYGRVLQELTFAPLLSAAGGGGSWVVDGFDLPAAGAGITSKTVVAGEAVIEGYRVATHSTGFSIDLYDDTTNYIYLRLLKSLSKVTEVVVEVNDTGVAPANSITLGTCLTAAGAISTTTDTRPSNSRQSGWYTGDGAASQTVTVPALGSERCTMYAIGDWDAAGPVMGVFMRCNMDRELWVQLADSASVAVTDSAPGTYFVDGGIKVWGASAYNFNNYDFYYVILA